MKVRRVDPEVAARAVEHLFAEQDGVIARRQAIEAGLSANDVRRLLRRREWTLLHPGVYANHTGVPTWTQRAWAAVLLTEPSALCRESALRACDGPGRKDRDDDVVQVAVDRQRGPIATPTGVVVYRMAHLEARMQHHTHPPRIGVEDTVIDLAAQARTEAAAISRLADAVQARLTTAPRLLSVVRDRKRLRRRSFLVGVLTDIAGGTCSLLEHGYLTRVELAHGLPSAARQIRASARGPIFRDAVYEEQRLVVELDGRLFHDNAKARDRDLDRDLDAAVDGLETRRIGWGQVFDRPCATAAKLGALLQQRGWTGHPASCPECGSGTAPRRGVSG